MFRTKRKTRLCGVGVVTLLAMALIGGCTAKFTVITQPQFPVDYSQRCFSPAPCQNMVIIGDSVAEGDLAVPGWQRWQDMLARAMGGGDESQVTHRRFDGSISGTGPVTQWDFARVGFGAAMFQNLPQYLPPTDQLGHLNLTVLALGANDEGQNVDPNTYRTALNYLLDKYPADRCLVVSNWEWASAFHAPWFPSYPAPVYRAVAADVAAQRGCVWVDPSTLVPNGVGAPPLAADGQHMSLAGQAAVGQMVLSAMGY